MSFVSQENSTQTILCLNSGSSSLKFHLYEMGLHPCLSDAKVGFGGKQGPCKGEEQELYEELLGRGAVEGIGQPAGRLWFVDKAGSLLVEKPLEKVEHELAVEAVLEALAREDLPSVEAVGHRIVHGGPSRFAPELVTSELIADLRAHVAWAPLHIPVSVRVVEALRSLYPDLPQAACFDTAFHAGLPEIAVRFPLPRHFFVEGVRKYGFHGLSYEYLLSVLGERARGRLIMAHLGNGASMVACRDGLPVETTMGMTPLGGFMMGTRTGDMDPGVLLYLMREYGYDHRRLEQLLDKESGLKGVSGRTGDMQTLLELRARGDEAATQAVAMFGYHLRKTVGALAAVLGGIDCLVFSGGIGEHAAPIRELVCRGLEHLGVQLDPARNEKAGDSEAGSRAQDGDERKVERNGWVISAEEAPCTVMVVPTNEELVIARHTYRLVFVHDD